MCRIICQAEVTIITEIPIIDVLTGIGQAPEVSTGVRNAEFAILYLCLIEFVGGNQTICPLPHIRLRVRQRVARFACRLTCRLCGVYAAHDRIGASIVT